LWDIINVKKSFEFFVREKWRKVCFREERKEKNRGGRALSLTFF